MVKLIYVTSATDTQTLSRRVQLNDVPYVTNRPWLIVLDVKSPKPFVELAVYYVMLKVDMKSLARTKIAKSNKSMSHERPRRYTMFLLQPRNR